ncbi:hypothetical protein TCAL_13992 [Tigriopus californicus]|uniref:Uncharacterized protein n=1 Tax=Tigriopus californicus TaxID=6832 RepID=A0A553PDH6_TIGCA|nr:uncharacterized protein LOC131893132 [Tigriopus californicus]TRY75738.1 hypothetical protein TCAL_13992 [Tigriopus californicus]|eukprot:TCALIF_13992-PA protein Name:"Protein of unknown function" AED:0.00 eAED:0.00 QI:60/1/1/1/0/1/2/132/162
MTMKHLLHVFSLLCLIVQLVALPSEYAQQKIFHALDEIFERKDNFPTFPQFGSGLPPKASHLSEKSSFGEFPPFNGFHLEAKNTKDDGDTSGYGPQGDLLPPERNSQPRLPIDSPSYDLAETGVLYAPDIAYEDQPREYIYDDGDGEGIRVDYSEYPADDFY